MVAGPLGRASAGLTYFGVILYEAERTASAPQWASRRRWMMRPLSPLRSLIWSLVLLAGALTFSPASWAAPKYKVLHAFTGDKDGGGLWGSLLLDASGNLYGTTVVTVFELTPHPGGRWRFKILSHGNDGGYYGGLIFDPTGNLYGGAPTGGPYGNGTVFELSPGPHGWRETVLSDFPP